MNEAPKKPNIAKQISRLTIALTYKFQMGTANDRMVLATSINVLTQALILSETDTPEASKLYTAAMKMSNLVGKVL